MFVKLKKLTSSITPVIVLLVGCNHNLIAQENETDFDKGTCVISVGYSFVDVNKKQLRNTSAYSDGFRMIGYGPITLKADYSVLTYNKRRWAQSLGVGAVLAYNYTEVTFNHTIKQYYGPQYYNIVGYYTGIDRYKIFTIGVSGTYHFCPIQGIDMYTTMATGFNIGSYSQSSSNSIIKPDASTITKPSILYLAISLGARYYWTKQIATYFEVGWDNSALAQVGLAIKIKK